jgi:rubrerythrin
MERERCRRMWADPLRKVLTLESFSRTEEDGGRDIVAALQRVQDSELRLHLERHARDEVRHADLFRRRAAALRASAQSQTTAEDPGAALDLGRGRTGQNAHGFFNAGVLEERGEIAYVAMLHVAEKKARDIFEMHAELTVDDPETHKIFTEILKDEKYHVSYTGKFLEQWRKEGLGREVRKSLRSARGSRFLQNWKNLGLRCGAGLSRFVLYLFYWTLLLPFGLIARLRNRAEPGRPYPQRDPARALRSQY